MESQYGLARGGRTAHRRWSERSESRPVAPDSLGAVGRDDWHRAPTWTLKARRLFEEKLSRARRRGSYLRVQGSILGASDRARDRQASKELLQRAINEGLEGDDWHAAMEAFWALFELGVVEERDGDDVAAEGAYRQAHELREQFPSVHLPAALHLASLIARTKQREKYDEALDLLDWTWQNDRPVFYKSGFRYSLARARIAADSDDRAEAKRQAREALILAGIEVPQLRRHPDVGLVDADRETIRELQRLVG